MKVFVLCVVLAVCTAITGCGDDGSNVDNVGETVVIDGVNINSNEIEIIMKSKRISEDEAVRFLVDAKKRNAPAPQE